MLVRMLCDVPQVDYPPTVVVQRPLQIHAWGSGSNSRSLPQASKRLYPGPQRSGSLQSCSFTFLQH